MATRSIVPRADNEGGIGTAIKAWATGFIKAITSTTVNALTLAAAAVGFTITGGTTPKTLTLTADTSLDQAVAMSSKAPLDSPSFTVGIGIGGIAAGAGGIAFPATQVPVADANTLDDYEEGSWTVALTCGTSGTIALAPAFNIGYYTKIGRAVSVQLQVNVDSVSSPVGDLRISLPFTVAALTQNAGYAPGTCGLWGISFDVNANGLFAQCQPSVAYCIIREIVSNAGAGTVDGADVAATDWIGIGLTFIT